MKKLLQIGIEVNSGSTGRIAEQIGVEALKNGWKSYITYARGYNKSDSEVIKIGNKLNIYYHVLQTRLFGNHLKSSGNATRKLIKRIQEINPDIIQMHQLHGYYLNLELLFNFLCTLKVPIVWTLHDCWAFTGHCAYFSLVNCNKWVSECNKCPQINKYPRTIVDKSKENYLIKKELFNSLQNLTIVTVSEWLNQLTKKSFLGGHKIITIQNGVDINQFYPRKNFSEIKNKYNIPEGKIIMGVGTIWTHSKGLFDYYKLRLVLPVNINVVLVGLTQNQIKTLPKGIIGISRTESISELAELYSVADIITCLSYQESFGLTPIEGFACGTPSVVYNSTALPELITSKVGEIVEAGNIEEVKNSISRILQNGKEYYFSNCIEWARTLFDVRIKYESYLTLYSELMVSNNNN
jgi:putative colanic acid biosynthesis glycosyltransferase